MFDPWDKIEWSGSVFAQETDWSNYEIIITIHGIPKGVPNARIAAVTNTISYSIAEEFSNGALVYVPLRAVTEMLGFVPQWNAERRQVVVNGPLGEIFLDIHQTEYELTTESGITLNYTMPPPLLSADRTYVPLQFFREMFGFTNAWFEGGQVHLDNAEIMQ
jgi:hypothetical protein